MPGCGDGKIGNVAVRLLNRLKSAFDSKFRGDLNTPLRPFFIWRVRKPCWPLFVTEQNHLCFPKHCAPIFEAYEKMKLTDKALLNIRKRERKERHNAFNKTANTRKRAIY
jgi:hypothetical protein